MFQNIWESNYQNKIGVNKYPWDQVVSFIFNHIPQSTPRNQVKILELGFGSGCNLWFCAREGFDCYGIEGSKTAYEGAKNWFIREKLNASLENSLFYPLNFEDNFFDIIIDRASLTCLSTQDCLLSMQEARRVLKKDGLFLFTPYSKKHQSFVEGQKLQDGLVEVISGTLMNVGRLSFYDYEDIQGVIRETSLKIEKIEHIEKIDIINKTNHSEWQVILRKA